MLEIGRTYPKPELSLIFGTRDKQGLDRKLTRYGIVFDACGRGERATYNNEECFIGSVITLSIFWIRRASPYKVTESGITSNSPLLIC